MFRPARIRRDERQIDFVFLGTRERNLGLLGFFLDALDRVRLLRQIDAGVFLKFADNPIHYLGIPVVTAKVCIAVGRFHFENAITDFEHGNVERAAAQIVYCDLLIFLFVETVSERGRRRLIDNAQHLKACDLACILCRVALRVVEICRNGDDRLRNFFAELRLRIGFHLRQDHRGNFRWRKSLALSVYFQLHVRIAVRSLHDLVWNAMLLFVDLVELAAHEPLDRENRILRISHRLTFRGLAD